jgi:hypothetical protein
VTKREARPLWHGFLRHAAVGGTPRSAASRSRSSGLTGRLRHRPQPERLAPRFAHAWSSSGLRGEFSYPVRRASSMKLGR